MNTQVAVSSLAINRNNVKYDFQKYNIEVSIEETENRITSNKLKFALTLLSNPKNVRISVEGTTEITGTESECVQAMEKDENGIPRVLHLIYQDIFPTIFMTTKVVGAPCPAYRLSQISAPSEMPESEITPEQPAVEAVADGEVTPEQPTPAPEQPTPAPEQPTPAPEQPTPAPEQPTPAPEQPTPAPEQPTPAPEQPTATEKKPEEMSLDELNQFYAKLGSEYQNNPSAEVGEKLQNVSNLIQKRQQEQMVTESSM